MPQLVPYTQQVTPDGTISGVKATAEDFGGQTGEALTKAGTQAAETSTAVYAVQDQQAKMRAAAALTQADVSWRTQLLQMQTDPDFASKYGPDGSGFAGAVKTQFEDDANNLIGSVDPRQQKYIEDGMYNLGQSIYGSALEYQAQAGAAFAVNTVKTSIDNGRQSADMSPDQYTSIMANTNLVIAQAHVTPEVRLKMQDAATQEVTMGAALGTLKKGGPAAAQQILDNKMAFVTVGEDGKPQTVNVRDIVDEKTYATLSEQATRVIKEADSAQKQQVESDASDLRTAMEFAQQPEDFVDISQQIENSAGRFGNVKANELRIALHEKEKGMLKEIDSVNHGSAFASGEAYLNPGSSDDVKDYNTYYDKQVAPTLAQQSPEERNTRIANMITTSKVVPESIKGDVKSAARSNDPKVVANAADLVDRIGQVQPQLLKDFDQADVAKISMTNALMANGYTATEAMTRVQDATNVNNKSIMEGRENVLKGSKINYANKAVANFAGFFERHFALDATSNFSSRQITQLTSDYRQAYDTQYKLTGDQAEAEKFADRTVQGTYGVTNINGTDQLMRYAPEKYYAVPNVPNTWMRDQVKEAADTVLHNSLSPPGTSADKNVLLVPDPLVTPRTAKAGAPAYKLMYKNDAGELSDLLGPGKYFTFDPQKVKDQQVQNARDKASRRADPLSVTGNVSTAD